MLSCFSPVCLFATLWTVACQASLSKEFSRQEYWSGLLCLPPGDLPDPGIDPRLLHLLHWQMGSLPLDCLGGQGAAQGSASLAGGGGHHFGTDIWAADPSVCGLPVRLHHTPSTHVRATAPLRVSLLNGKWQCGAFLKQGGASSRQMLTGGPSGCQ